MKKGQSKKFISVKAYFKLIREQNELTQQELADKLKIHVQYVSNWERGECLPPAKQLKWFLDQFSEKDVERFKLRLGLSLAENIVTKAFNSKGKF